MPLFVLSMMTAIVTLMWSIQLFVRMPLTGITIFLNLWFMFMWLSLAYFYVRKAFKTQRNELRTLLRSQHNSI
jgi:uncharacterized protein YacL